MATGERLYVLRLEPERSAAVVGTREEITRTTYELRDVHFTCTLDCAWELRVLGAANGGTRLRLTGYGRAGLPIVVSLTGRKLGTGPVRFSLTLSQPVNPGAPQTQESATVSLR